MPTEDFTTSALTTTVMTVERIRAAIPLFYRYISLLTATTVNMETWLREWDLNPRPERYERSELPDCSTPRQIVMQLQT